MSWNFMNRLLPLIGALLLSVMASAAYAAPPSAENRARYQKASELFSQGKLAEARIIARLMIADQPRFALAWNLLGMSYEAMGKGETLDLAVEAFEHANKLDPKSPEPLRNLAKVAEKTGDLEDAAKYLVQAADLAPEDLKLQLMTARFLFVRNRFEEARQRYMDVLELEPSNMNAITGIGEIYRRGGQYSKAIELYHEVLDGGVDNPILYVNLSEAYLASARYEEARDFLKTRLDSLPDAKTNTGAYADLYLKLARAHIGNGEYNQAETVLKMLVEGAAQPEKLPYPFYHLGLALALQGKNQEALEAFQTVVKGDPDFRDVQIRLGLAQLAAGKLEEAEATLRAVTAGGDEVPAEAFGALAITLFAFGKHPDGGQPDIEEAIRLYRQARELAPDFDTPSRLSKFRKWPPSAISAIKELRALTESRTQASKDAAEARGGLCSCAIRSNPSHTHAGLSLLLLSAFLAALRRRRHA